MSPAERYLAALSDRLDRPLAAALSLDSEFYIDPDIFAAETRMLGARTWQVLAAQGQMPEPGCVQPVTVSGQGFVLARQADGKIRCFHNVCKHRGVPLLHESRQGVTALRCTYHGWRYRLDGSLERASHFNGINDHRLCGVDPSCLDLDEIPCATWHGLIFANLGGKALPLDIAMGAIDRRWGDYDFTQFQLGGELQYRIAGNWKLVVENFLDSYHNPFVHPALNKASSWEVHYPIISGEYFGVGSRDYHSDVAGHGSLPTMRGLSPERQRCAEYLCVTPTLMLGIHADYLFVLTIDPIDAQTTGERVYFFFAGGDGDHQDLPAARESVMRMWDRINREDIPVIEGMQQCRRSSSYGPSVFSPFHEGPLHAFQRSIAQMMANEQQAPSKAVAAHDQRQLVGSEA